MNNYGNFGKNYIREVVVKDNDGNDVLIKLKYTAMTPLLYMNYFGTDMFEDTAKIASKNMLKDKIMQKIEDKGIDSLSVEEINEISTQEALVFFDNFAVALVATSLYPQTVSYDTIRDTMLPSDFISDDRYAHLFIAIQELFEPVMSDYKKKLIQVAHNMGKSKM